MCVCVCVCVFVCLYVCGIYVYTNILHMSQRVFIHTCKCIHINIEVNNMYDWMMHTLLTIVGPLVCTMPMVVESHQSKAYNLLHTSMLYLDIR